MWEISVSIDKSNHGLFNDILTKLTAAMRKAVGVVMLDDDGSRTYLTLACEEEYKDRIYKLLLEEITKIYIDDFKQQYLKKNARLPMNNKVNYNAFIRALVAFDSEFDREIVNDLLELEDGLMVEGFFHFKLKELKTRWKEVCELANDNAAYLGYHDTFLELMRFLINTLECKADEVIIESAEDGYNIFDCAKMETTFATDDTLVSSVINLSPNIINVYEDGGIPAHILNLMQELYKHRVKMIKLV